MEQVARPTYHILKLRNKATQHIASSAMLLHATFTTNFLLSNVNCKVQGATIALPFQSHGAVYTEHTLSSLRSKCRASLIGQVSLHLLQAGYRAKLTRNTTSCLVNKLVTNGAQNMVQKQMRLQLDWDN